MKQRGILQSQILVLALLFATLMAGILCGCTSTQQESESSTSAEQQTQAPEAASSEIVPSDYSEETNWLAKPRELVHEADVLYFYPTCYMPESENDPRICNIDNAGMRAGAQMKLLDQASAFEASADLYAPYYRQVDAASLAGLSQEEMLEVESAEPKADVFASLDYYFEHYNKGRPFVLAGHSQGAMMIQLILDEYMEENPAIYERMVAAYMIGNAATESWLDLNPHVTLAQNADDTGVLVTWNTEGPDNKDQYNMVAPQGSVCINPLNWKTDATPAGIEENLGTLVEDDEGNYIVTEGIANATIDTERGTVICTSVDPQVYAIPSAMKDLFGTQSYHSWDIKFYYENIRQNVADRIASYLSE